MTAPANPSGIYTDTGALKVRDFDFEVKAVGDDGTFSGYGSVWDVVDSYQEIVARGADLDTVKRVERLLYVAEYKRRQAPPGPKVSVRNFDRDRRYPITNGFRENPT